MQKQAEKSARVAQLEDSARVTNVANKQHAIRPSKLTRYKFHQVVPPPNTVPIPTGAISASEGVIRKNGLTYRVTRPPSVVSMRSEPGVDEAPEPQEEGFSEGNSGFPPESTADSESDGMAVGEVDENEDEDFVMEQNKSEASEEETEAILPSRAKKGKSVPKAPRGTFRLQVQGLRQEPPAFGAVVEASNKRTFKEATLDDAPSAKRGKKSEGGLMANWKKLVNYTNASSTQKSAPQKSATQKPVPSKDVNTEIVEGEFDHEDTFEALAAVRASKPSMVKVQDSHKAMPAAVKIVEKPLTDVTVDTAGRPKRVKFVVNNLPFPGGPQNTAYHAKWRKHARASFIDYAATRPCAYRANSDLTPEVVRTIWNDNFPELNMEAHPQQSSGTPLEAVTAIGGDVLTDWRSSIGMNALDVLSALFAEYKLSKDEIIAFVPHMLEGFRFIYAEPDAPPNKKGGFKSDLILNLFAYHFKKTNNAPRSYGSQAGGLGLCTAAMERALFLWRSGENPIKDEKGNKKKIVSQFNDSDWGPKMRGWTESASRLEPEDWAYIFEEANARAGLNGLVDDDDTAENAESDPRATIEL